MVFAAFLSSPVVFATSASEVITTLLAFAAVGGVARLVFQHWRRHECHVAGCHRMQWKPVPGTDHVVCRKHHPLVEPSHAEVLEDHARAG